MPGSAAFSGCDLGIHADRVLLGIVIIVRTAREDAFLQAEPEGYHEDAGRVYYRWLRVVW
ncbi:MAG: hypothetical protein ACK2UW_24135 [Anaerolineales bacterium]